jgi:hypothetical protein
VLQDWLYGDGEDEKKSVYVAKLEELKKLGEPVKLRFVEDQTRGPAASSLRSTGVPRNWLVTRCLLLRQNCPMPCCLLLSFSYYYFLFLGILLWPAIVGWVRGWARKQSLDSFGLVLIIFAFDVGAASQFISIATSSDQKYAHIPAGERAKVSVPALARFLLIEMPMDALRSIFSFIWGGGD